MSQGYRLAYRLGLTPWEKAGNIFEAKLDTLLDAIDPPPGKALDVGCGTGDHALALAARGWQVTGVDAVPLAIERARAKARSAGSDVRFLVGDVTALDPSVGSGYRLVLDIGCFHGLTDAQRAAYATEVTAVTDPGASLLMFAFGPGHRAPLPRGASRADVERTFTGWTLVTDDASDTSGILRPLRRSNPRWFRLTRR